MAVGPAEAKATRATVVRAVLAPRRSARPNEVQLPIRGASRALAVVHALLRPQGTKATPAADVTIAAQARVVLLVGPKQLAAAAPGVGVRPDGRHLAAVQRPAAVRARDGHAAPLAHLRQPPPISAVPLPVLLPVAAVVGLVGVATAHERAARVPLTCLACPLTGRVGAAALDAGLRNAASVRAE